MRKAYDSVPRMQLFQYLHEAAVEADDPQVALHLVEILKEMYNGHSIVIEGEKITKKIYTTRGVPQGSCLSPKIFNFFLDKVLKQSLILVDLINDGRLLAFADDIILAAMDEDELKIVVEELRRVLAENGM